MSTPLSLSRPRAALLLFALVGALAAPQVQAAGAASPALRTSRTASALFKTAPAQILVTARGLTDSVLSSGVESHRGW